MTDFRLFFAKRSIIFLNRPLIFNQRLLNFSEAPLHLIERLLNLIETRLNFSEIRLFFSLLIGRFCRLLGKNKPLIVNFRRFSGVFGLVLPNCALCYKKLCHPRAYWHFCVYHGGVIGVAG